MVDRKTRRKILGNIEQSVWKHQTKAACHTRCVVFYHMEVAEVASYKQHCVQIIVVYFLDGSDLPPLLSEINSAP